MGKHQSLLVFFLLLLFEFSVAQEGILDTNFADNGFRKFSFTDRGGRGTDLLLLDDGSLILAINFEERHYGSFQHRGFYIYKISSEGNVDNTFGTDGYLYFPNNPNNNTESSYFFSMLLQLDGKILIMATIEGNSNLIRIYENGLFDSSFGNDGVLNIESGNRIGQQSTGKIVVQSQYYDGYNNLYRFSRYNIDGSIDTSFGLDGTQITDVTSYRFDLCFTIKIDGNDKLIAAGSSYNNGDDNHPVISRFNPDGSLDTSFGNNGTVIVNFSTESNLGEFNDIALFDDKIIVGGNYQYLGGTGGFYGIKPALAKFNDDGTLDATFGQGGKLILNTQHNANDRLRSIVVQNDGKIILGGGSSYPFPITQTDLTVIKLNENGSPYPEFGQNGVFITNFGGANASYTTDLVLTPDNKILVYGCTKDANNEFRNAIICRLKNEVLGTEDLKFKDKIQIFPNPTSDYIYLRSTIPIRKMVLYTIAGQLSKVQSYAEENRYEIECDLSKLQAGIYIALISLDGQKMVTKKIVKKG